MSDVKDIVARAVAKKDEGCKSKSRKAMKKIKSRSETNEYFASLVDKAVKSLEAFLNGE
jgi:hypothetical protein